MQTIEKGNIRTLVLAALCLSLCMVLPIIAMQIPQIGSALSPMHIPVLLCGFVCGWRYGLVVGLIAPLMRSLIFGMPNLFPTATVMAFELAAYGLATGILYQLLPKKNSFIYVTLIASMLLGRFVWGIASVVILGFVNQPFTLAIFWARGFANAVPGIILHIAIVPVIVIALKRANFIENK